MARQRPAVRSRERTELLGIRVTAALKTEIKVKAAQRRITIAELFEDMWRIYREQERAKPD
jgi:hypothetical protein